MTIQELQDKILRIKKERGICILAHSYQAREIIEIADYTGDSFQLSVMAGESEAKTAVMCGVRFMAETVKILSPEKRVFLANGTAGCPMAEQMDRELILGVKAKYPGYTVAAYINTTAELKRVCDVCVTSSSAVKIIGRLPGNDIIFLPDCNLGAYVASQLPKKNIKLLQGGCPIHAAVNPADVAKVRAEHPEALILAHPECVPKVLEKADFIGSTSEIMSFAIKSDRREFIIGTEMSIAEHLQYMCPEKRFYSMSHKLICPNMRVTTLADVYNCICEESGEITLSEDVIREARVCIDRMIELGK